MSLYAATGDRAPNAECLNCGRVRSAHDYDEDAGSLDCPNWFQTVSGIRFFPTAPRVGDVQIGDIAHALAHLCRFAGHCRVHYSVAQHSVLVATLVPHPLAMAALLHDAAEAYVVDLPRPLKHSPLLKGYRAIEQRVERVIEQRFGLTLTDEDHCTIKNADRRALATERRDVLTDHGHHWHSTELVEPDPTTIIPWTPRFAAEQFRIRFMELGGQL